MPEQEQPVDPEVVLQMNAIAKVLDETLNPEAAPRKWGFALFVFQFGQGDDHRSNYISNASRDDMIATMKEFIARVEGTYVDPHGPSQ